jgi:hypothetical protein
MAGIGLLELILMGIILVPIAIVVMVIIFSSGYRKKEEPTSNLAPCPDCQAPVSIHAVACPKCGCPIRPAEPN